MILDWDFIFFGTLIVLILIPLYFYKDKILHLFYKKHDFKQFLHNTTVYVHDHYPNINFDLNTIVKKTLDEPNDRTRAILVIENIVNQFVTYEYSSTHKPAISKELLWSNYLEYCKPIKSKLPLDWSKRKDFTWQRDQQCCQRCGLKLDLNNAHIELLKPIKEGGQYNFENLQTLCNDCAKILKSNDLVQTSKSLQILDKLLDKVN
ncbi:MAG: HNH endonuclease signature motif containing protein [Campylobacterota bacterium]|nr:HNH endonuclease signature motif containing protein [Campylobacterota bacterium]